MRRCYGEQACQHYLAKRHLHGNLQPMATEWFYITEPRGTKWAAAPVFRSGPPLWLASWINKGLDRGSADEVQTLQSRIRSILERDIGLINVIQVMLVRRILPCQRRPLRMWEFNPEGPRTLQKFFGTMHEGMRKLFSRLESSGRTHQRTSVSTATIRIPR